MNGFPIGDINGQFITRKRCKQKVFKILKHTRFAR